MYVFLVILVSGLSVKKSVSLVRTEIIENQNTRFLNFFGTDQFLFFLSRFSSKIEEPNTHPEIQGRGRHSQEQLYIAKGDISPIHRLKVARNNKRIVGGNGNTAVQ